MVHPWSTAAVKVLGVAAGSRQIHAGSEVQISAMYAASDHKLKYTSSIYGLRLTILPDCPSCKHIKTDALVRGGKERV